MATQSKSRKKKHNDSGKPVRPGDVKLLVSRKLYGAAVRQLRELVKPGSGTSNGPLVAEVLMAVARAVDEFAFTPENTEELLIWVRDLSDRVAVGANEADKAKITQAVGRISFAIAGELEADVASSPEMLPFLADQSIRRPEFEKRLPPELIDEAIRVRAALEHVSQHQFEQASTAVAEIGFRSIMAPWRLLIRGMISYYQNRISDALTTFERLPTDRLPFSIAKVLMAIAGRNVGTGHAFDIRRLDKSYVIEINERNVLTQDAKEALADRDIEDFLSQIKTAIGKNWIESQWLARFTERLYGELLYEFEDDYIIDSLADIDGPAFDACFKLPRELLQLTGHSPLKEDVAVINNYVDSIAKHRSISDPDRPAVLAILRNAVAERLFLIAARENQAGPHSGGGNTVSRQALTLGLKQIEAVMRTYPKWSRSYDSLKNLQLPETKPIQTAIKNIHQARLEGLGNDLEVMLDAAEYFVEASDEKLAEPLLTKIGALAPRNERLLQIRAASRAKKMDQLVKLGKLSEAIELLDSLIGSQSLGGVVSIQIFLKATLLLMSQRDEEAAAVIQAAKDSGVTPLMANLATEASLASNNAQPKLKKPFQAERKALLKQTDFETMCQLCEKLPKILFEGSDFAGKKTLAKDLVTYLKRTLSEGKDYNWTSETINSVGGASIASEDMTLMRHFGNQGGKAAKYQLVQFVSVLGEISESQQLYGLQTLLEEDYDAEHRMSNDLIALAERSYRVKRKLYYGASDDLYDDDDYDDDDDDDNVFDPRSSDVSIPPEMLAAFALDPKGVEAQIRQVAPPPMANVLIELLRRNSYR